MPFDHCLILHQVIILDNMFSIIPAKLIHVRKEISFFIFLSSGRVYIDSFHLFQILFINL